MQDRQNKRISYPVAPWRGRLGQQVASVVGNLIEESCSGGCVGGFRISPQLRHVNLVRGVCLLYCIS